MKQIIFLALVFLMRVKNFKQKEIIITPNDDIKEGKFFNFSNINLVFKKTYKLLKINLTMFLRKQ